MTAPPTPTGVYRQWFPASIKLDDRPLITNARVILADTGLFVYKQAPVQMGTDGEPVIAAAANYAAGPAPAARVPNGYYLQLADGSMAVITSSGNCGCGSKLKRWMPNWAVHSLPWPVAA